MRHALTIAVIAAAMLSGGVAQAYDAGDWIVRVGASNVDPDDPNGSLLGLDVDVDDDTSVTFIRGYSAWKRCNTGGSAG
mgnify:CR=1 FL=1